MIEYKYDALGRRVAASSGGVETYRLYDTLGRCVKELTTADSGETLAGEDEYVYGSGFGEAVRFDSVFSLARL
ncbi:hypothetical protein [Sedimentisphaera salicampi]|uniref:YD repeat (Two copies) n=1 Tax=Sedimentisphaera salicampi TaxID=1941349 RepID=A0A1W6LNU8_9BACT|nr:hypothetical protein [Sedimentisphaera salicampi]ARN57475.1 hypothetical protein STSP1_01885 [Sedimentisphaera salicampi]